MANFKKTQTLRSSTRLRLTDRKIVEVLAQIEAMHDRLNLESFSIARINGACVYEVKLTDGREWKQDCNLGPGVTTTAIDWEHIDGFWIEPEFAPHADLRSAVLELIINGGLIELTVEYEAIP